MTVVLCDCDNMTMAMARQWTPLMCQVRESTVSTMRSFSVSSQLPTQWQVSDNIQTCDKNKNKIKGFPYSCNVFQMSLKFVAIFILFAQIFDGKIVLESGILSFLRLTPNAPQNKHLSLNWYLICFEGADSFYLLDVENNGEIYPIKLGADDITPQLYPSDWDFEREELIPRPVPQKRWGFLNKFFDDSTGYRARKPYLGCVIYFLLFFKILSTHIKFVSTLLNIFWTLSGSEFIGKWCWWKEKPKG